MIQRYVIQHKKNKSFYQKKFFVNQRHFVKNINEAKYMTFEQASKILNNFKSKNDYEIKEVKKWKV